MLSYAMLRHVMLCYVMLCYVTGAALHRGGARQARRLPAGSLV